MTTMTLACALPPSASAAVVADRIHAVASDGARAAGGIITGEITRMKLSDSVEPAFGRARSPARLSGWLVLRNVSAEQIVRLVGVDLHYMDSRHRPLKLEAGRANAAIRIATPQIPFDRLEPGQAVTELVYVEIPATKRLKQVRFVLSFVTSPSRDGNYPIQDDSEQTLKFTISIASG